MSGGLKRRELIKGALVAGVGAIAGTAEGQTPAEDSITASDLAAANRVLGLHYSQNDRVLMTPLAEETRGQLATLRGVNLDPVSDPATRFDPLLPGMRLKTGRSVCNLSRQAAPNYNGKIESLAFCTVAELSRLVRTRRITSLELTTMYLTRLKKFGPLLHCVVNLTEDLALQQAKRADAEIAAGQYRGPLHGIPWGAKDLFATRGIPTTWGAKPYEHQIFDYNATVVERLEAAGAVLVAKLGSNSWPNLFRVGSTIPAADYLQALRIRRRLQEQMALTLGDLDGFVSLPFAGPVLTYTNLTGHPALITRCGMQDGRPVSLEFVGGLYKEAEILRLAFAFEQATPWHKQWPDTQALLNTSTPAK